VKKITWEFPVVIAIGVCLVMAVVSAFKRDDKARDEQKRASYNQGWRDAVLDCYDKKILQGPLVLTGESPFLNGTAITVVNIITTAPTICLSNSTHATVANCSFDYREIR